jgi:hypothetical protein
MLACLCSRNSEMIGFCLFPSAEKWGELVPSLRSVVKLLLRIMKWSYEHLPWHYIIYIFVLFIVVHLCKTKICMRVEISTLIQVPYQHCVEGLVGCLLWWTPIEQMYMDPTKICKSNPNNCSIVDINLKTQPKWTTNFFRYPKDLPLIFTV